MNSEILYTENFRISNENGIVHNINITIENILDGIKLTALYIEGQDNVKQNTVVACWSAQYEYPNENDLGYVNIGLGRIEIEPECLRGIGLGSVLMMPIIEWIHLLPIVPIVPILLSADDAQELKTRNIRNRFYEKLGFEFEYKDNETHGESIAMKSNELILPCFRLLKGWGIESISD